MNISGFQIQKVFTRISPSNKKLDPTFERKNEYGSDPTLETRPYRRKKLVPTFGKKSDP